MSLPSYSIAINALRKPAVWELVAVYMDASSLATCCLISHELNAIFTRILWYNPIPLILENIRIPCRNVLSLLSTREEDGQLHSRRRALVKILDFRPLGRLRQQCDLQHEPWTCHELITGRNVQKRLRHFPNCKILLLDKLPGWSECDDDVDPILGGSAGRSSPFVLSAANCEGLSIQEFSAPNGLGTLLYLDLSGLSIVEKIPSTFNFSTFPNLRVLKMRAMRLQDKHMEQISVSFGPRLWCLDIRDNQLTDRIIPFLKSLTVSQPPRHSGTSPNFKYLAEAPAYYGDEISTDSELANNHLPLRPANADGIINYLKSHGDLGSREPLSHDDPLLQLTGLTHLYASGNKLTSRVVSNLLMSSVGSRIQKLDIGSVLIPDYVRRDVTNRCFLYATEGCLLKEQVLHDAVAPRLEELRIHHSLVTSVIDTSNGKLRNPSKTLDEAQQLLNDSFVAFSDPDINPHICTLTLTSIPLQHSHILRRLTAFLRACAEQEQAIKSFLSTFTNNGINPKRTPKTLTGLRVLRLEFLPKIERRESSMSASGEGVADNFLEESSKDFSFFGDGDEVRTFSPLRNDDMKRTEKESDKNGKRRKSEVENDGKDAEDIVTGLKRYRASPESTWSGRLELVFSDK